MLTIKVPGAPDDFLSPSPPSPKTAARQDQTRQSSTRQDRTHAVQQSKRDYSITSSARVGASTNLGCIHPEPPATLATTAQVKLTLLDRQRYEFLNVDRIVDAFWAVVVDLIVYRKHNTLRLTLLLRGINTGGPR